MNPTTCIHYRSPTHNTTCEKGILLGSSTRAPKHALPCLGFVRERFKIDFTEIPCPHFTLPTKKQIEEDEARWKAATDRLQKVRPITDPIREEFKGKGFSGTRICPNCGTTLFLRMAPNGHMRGNCETLGCVHWIE